MIDVFCLEQVVVLCLYLLSKVRIYGLYFLYFILYGVENEVDVWSVGFVYFEIKIVLICFEDFYLLESMQFLKEGKIIWNFVKFVRKFKVKNMLMQKI